MSRHSQNVRNGVKIPSLLQQERELHDDQPRGRHSSSRQAVSSVFARKVQRQNAGEMRRGGQVEVENHPQPRKSQIEIEGKAAFDRNRPNERKTSRDLKPNRHSLPEKPKPILERSPVRSLSLGSDDSDDSRSSSLGLVLDASSKTFKERSAHDDAEIATLEKRLGLSKRKTKDTGDDILEYLLEGIEAEDTSKQETNASREWLARKRRKIKRESDSDEDDEVDSDLDDKILALSDTDSAVEASDQGESDDFAGFSSDEPIPVDIEAPKKVRENPYVAPVTAESTTQRYVPPSLRSRTAQDESSLARLKRQIQGHLNKLSEANLISILNEIEQLYRNNVRQDVTTSLIDLLLSSFSDRSALQNTFIILHAAFVAAVYKVMGTDFGAEMLGRLVEQFDEHNTKTHNGKQALNLMSLLANLFTFGVISSNIVYDYIRILLADFNESNAELLLRIVRDCGPQLRSDDPSALKDIVQMVQNISSKMAKQGQQLNVRTRVMMDTIIDLKNNKLKNATNAAGVTGEHITRMRKTLGSLNSRNLKATEPLRITRKDIESSGQKGKWWLVGASWKGNDDTAQKKASSLSENPVDDTSEFEEQEVDYLVLAKRMRMNTDVRRSIFVAIMSAEDVRDAQMRLLKLRLSSKQEQEIAKVLLRCTRAEPVYNPYYALLAKNLCKENRKIRMGLQFGLWSFFNAIGESDEEDDDDNADDDEGQDVGLNEVVNIAKMFAYLVFHNHLTLGILKTLNIGFLKDKASMFLEILIISVMTQPHANEDALMKVFGRTADTPQVVKSLQYFINKHVRQSDLASNNEKKQVKEGCKVANVAFTMINSTEMNVD